MTMRRWNKASSSSIFLCLNLVVACGVALLAVNANNVRADVKHKQQQQLLVGSAPRTADGGSVGFGFDDVARCASSAGAALRGAATKMAALQRTAGGSEAALSSSSSSSTATENGLGESIPSPESDDLTVNNDAPSGPPVLSSFRTKGEYDVGIFTRRVDQFRQVTSAREFAMSVFHPVQDPPEGACFPVIVLLHPGQFLSSAPDTDFFDYGRHWASRGMVTVLSREYPGQFFALDAGSVTDIEGQRMGKRGGLMWYNLMRMNNTEPESPVYQRLCRRFCAVGYSMGGSAAQDMGIEFSPEDGIRCIAPMHALATNKVRASRVTVPTMSGSSPQDTLTPPYGVNAMWDAYVNSLVPYIDVVLQWGTHMLSECGASCPQILKCCEGDTNIRQHLGWMTAWLELHLYERLEIAPLIWNPPSEVQGGDGIGIESLVREVRLRPRFTIEPVERRHPVDLVTGKSRRFDAAVVVNSGRSASFTLRAESLTEDCTGKLTFRYPRAGIVVPRDGQGVLPLLVTGDPSLGIDKVCMVSVRVFSEAGYTTVAPIEVELKTVGCVLGDWTQETCDCPCPSSAPGVLSWRGSTGTAAVARRPTSGSAALARWQASEPWLAGQLRAWATRGSATPSAGLGATMRLLSSGDARLLPAAVDELVIASLAMRARGAGVGVGGGDDECGALMDAIDADRDGVLSRREASYALSALLESLDDSDGDDDSTAGMSSTSTSTLPNQRGNDDTINGDDNNGDTELSATGCVRSRGIVAISIPLKQCLRLYDIDSLFSLRQCTGADRVCTPEETNKQAGSINSFS